LQLPEIGTRITLRVAPQYAHMLETEVLARALIQYSDFIPYPILLNGAGPINTMHAPWHRHSWASEEQREEELRQFLDRRYPEVPLEVIPVDIEEPVRARGALFITHNRVPEFNSAGVVDVYVRRMFVRSGDPDLLPPWAKFVRGVIDSPDLQPNSARDNVRRHDPGFDALREQLGELILEELTRLATERPERMARLCKWHYFHLKGIAFLDDAFFDLVAELLFFDSNRGQVCLRDLLAAPQASDSGEAIPVYYVSAEGAASQYYKMAEARDWVVIDAGKPLDEMLLRKFAERNPARISLSPLDGAEHPDLFEPLEAGDEEAYRSLGMAVETTLRRHRLGAFLVNVRRYAPATLPAIALATPQTEADHQLEALAEAPWIAPGLAELTRRVVRDRIRPLQLLLNANHPLVQQLRNLGGAAAGLESVYLGLALTALLQSRKLLTERNVPVLHQHLTLLLEDVARTSAPQQQLPGIAEPAA
jgi:HSP90 family molecular chaperone